MEYIGNGLIGLHVSTVFIMPKAITCYGEWHRKITRNDCLSNDMKYHHQDSFSVKTKKINSAERT